MKFGGRDCSGVLAPAYLSFFTASVSFVLFLLTSVGNLLVCLAVYKDPNKELRTPFNFFVVNLACADLIVGFVVAPISVIVHLKEGLTDGPLDDEATVIHMSYFISCTASVLSLAALTIDRHIAITSPLYYRATTHTRKVVAASLAIWIISASVPLVYFEVGYISYAFVFVNTAVVLTLVILVVSYAHIFRKMRRNAVQLKAGVDSLIAARHAAERESRLTKAFLLMLTAFLSCYTPSCVMLYVANFCTTCRCYSVHWLRDTQFLFVLINSCLNPLVYARRIPAFRSAILNTPRRHRVEPQARINLPSMNNRAFVSQRCLNNPTTPSLQRITRKDQSDSIITVEAMDQEHAVKKYELNCVFDTRL